MKTLRNAMWVMLALAMGASAQARHPAGAPTKQIGTPTRQVVMFGQLERQLLEAKKDKTLLDAMLTEDFQEWSAENPGDSIDRETAMKLVQSAPAMQGGFRDMNVRMEGDTAIVSFVFLHRGEKDKGQGRATYVVDIWRKHGEAYELAARYSAPMRAQAMRDVRPTGKE